VKGTGDAKSRLGGTPRSRRALAKAIALDTVESVLSTPTVTGVLVVTSAAAAPDFAALGADVLVDDGAEGLNGAILRAISRAAVAGGTGVRGDEGVAVLLGDVPALDPTELAAALAAAAPYPLAMVPDADNKGTVLTTARRGVHHSPAFGPDSRAAHHALGYVEVAVAASSGLRRDVDTLDQLRALVDAAPSSAHRTLRAFAAV
jgi:2-phospho-L-lactate guanylyltransferase